MVVSFAEEHITRISLPQHPKGKGRGVHYFEGWRWRARSFIFASVNIEDDEGSPMVTDSKEGKGIG